ncbi:MAG: hypothetical protein NUW24_09060 [Anaerolineae bacterium]|nr:hypothetical protein [Anaerolineae bacterium]MDH7473174.1 hypothetical protein [Anaerolineae bacterium]
MNYLTLAGGLLFIGISVLSVYKPNWVWGRPPAGLNEAQLRRAIRRRQIGTVVYFALGALLLVLSTR